MAVDNFARAVGGRVGFDYPLHEALLGPKNIDEGRDRLGFLSQFLKFHIWVVTLD